MIDLHTTKLGDLVRAAMHDPSTDESYVGVVVCFEGVDNTTQPSGRVGVRWYGADGSYDDGYMLYWPHELRPAASRGAGANARPIGFAEIQTIHHRGAESTEKRTS